MKALLSFLNKAKRNGYILRMVSNETKTYLMTYRCNSFRLVDTLIFENEKEKTELVQTFSNENKLILRLS